MSTEIKDVVALSGAPGLHKILKADEKTIVIESLDERKKRQLVKGNMYMSKIVDVSIYVEGEEESKPLVEVLQAIQEKYGENELPVSKKSSKDELMGFLEEVLPNFDKEKVYPSNVKKLISWYKILNEQKIAIEMPEEEEEKDEEKPNKESKEKADNTAKKDSKKPKAKKEAASK